MCSANKAHDVIPQLSTPDQIHFVQCYARHHLVVYQYVSIYTKFH